MEEFDEWDAEDLRVMDRQRVRQNRKARAQRRELREARKAAKQ